MYDMFTYQQLAWIRYDSRLEQTQNEHASGHTGLNWVDRLAIWVSGLMIATGEYLTSRRQDECAPKAAQWQTTSAAR